MRPQEFMNHYKVRADGWSLDYGSALELTEEAVSKEKIQPEVEVASEDWGPVALKMGPEQALQDLVPVRVVDGVRRLHQRLVLELPDGFWYGGMGSIATGALEILPGQTRSLEQALIAARIERFALFGGVGEVFNTPLLIPGVPLPFQGRRISQENTPSAPVEALHTLMRQAEDALVNDLQNSQQIGLTLVDGPLQFHRIDRKGKVVGFVKSQYTRYLPSQLQFWVQRLAPRERTPLFGIGEDILSWYVNLGQTQLTDHALSGIVRLETVSDGSKTHLNQVIELANGLQALLPLLATLRHKDPRAPQNLVPVQALENALRRKMGSEMLIQRRLQQFLYSEIKAQQTKEIET
ncbi:MAG: hypothetical protein IV090_17095 [Candidatus Sericytochromatia bacterium]|nr:hypothetical protein [Candidatus Sericytochromatia bacterium]